jgi:hypothetical protein
MARERYPVIMTVHGDDFDNTYFCATEQDFHNACLEELASRVNVGYIYAPDEPKEKPLSVEELKQLPDNEAVLKTIQDQQTKVVQRWDEYEEEQEQVNLIATALRESDGELAWRILQSRNDYEYEYTDLQRVRPVTGPSQSEVEEALASLGVA